jgi:ATP-dependent Zn protease
MRAEWRPCVIPAPNQQARHPGFWQGNRLWIILLLLPLVALGSVFIFGLANAHSSGAEPVSYNLFIAQVKDHNVISVTLAGSSVAGTFKSPVASDQIRGSGTRFTATAPSANTNVVSTLLANGVQVNVDNDNSNGIWSTVLLQWMPTLVLAVITYLFLVGCLAVYLTGRSRLPAQHTPA